MEKGDVPVISEKSKQNGGNLRRNSTGKTMAKASLSPINTEDMFLPHYLRASTSSCHDFCKYGRTHAFEAKGITTVSSMFAKSTATPIQGQRQVNNLYSEERTKKPVVNMKVSPEQKRITPVSSMFAKRTATPVQGQKQIKNLDSEEKTKKPVIDMKVSPEQKGIIHVSSMFAKSTVTPIQCRKKINLDSEERTKKPGIKLKVSPEQKIESPVIKLKSLSSSKKIVVSAKPTLIKLKSFSPPKKTDISVTPTKVLKKKAITEKSPPSNPSGIIGRRPDDNKKVKSTGLSKIREKRELKPAIASFPSNPIGNGVTGLKTGKANGIRASFPKIPNKVRNITSIGSKFRERPLSGIETTPEDKVIEVVKHEIRDDRWSFMSSPLLLSSSSSSSSSSPRSLSSLEEMPEQPESLYNVGNNSDSSENEKRFEHMKGVEKRRLRRGAVIFPEAKDCTPRRLKFRSGSVINPQPENNGPRKLRFRRARTLSEYPKIETGRRSFRKKRESGFADSNGPRSGPQTVVLRHQDVQGKKDSQDINHVIEETANKLVETRKSKVKALVGAFETVISLQESKPVTTG